ncbi:hypothetical protein BV898_01193 [Hypsibius exemplaris]|uniref:Receptor ligand binding region domain-containing protein n=1 Tax=Hypsibius exemplaris TaxID=2072580 RepID=A0A1W0XBU7_HYPEX|nr:hypothetical protein BV898_01193 [Hypsibius exemplaris]
MNDFAGARNMLLITSSDADSVIRNRKRSPTWLTTTPFPLPNTVYCSLLNVLNWTTVFVGLNVDSLDRLYHQYAFSRVTAELAGCGIQFTVPATISSATDAATVRRMLRDFHRKSRSMREESWSGPLDFPVARTVIPWASGGFENFTWRVNANDDEKIKRAYRSVLLLTLVDEARYVSPTINSLIQEWLDISRRDYNNTNPPNELPIPIVTASHAAVEMAGVAAVEVLAGQHGKLTGDYGHLLADFIRNRTLDLQVGPWMMNSRGFAQVGVQIASFDWQTGHFQVFMKATENDIEETFDWIRINSTQSVWFGQADLPTGLPLCRLGSEECQTEKTWRAQVAGISCSVLLALAVLVVTLWISFCHFDISCQWRLKGEEALTVPHWNLKLLLSNFGHEAPPSDDIVRAVSLDSQNDYGLSDENPQ